MRHQANTDPRTVIVYLQGNAGNPLHRIPVFDTLLSSWPAGCAIASEPAPPVIMAVAPRSYWKSTNRCPTERGLLSDYTHVLHHTLRRYSSADIILYGHSLGGAAAICLMSRLQDPAPCDYSRIKGLIIENPFASIPGMVRALYPQRWLPYYHMAELAWDRWDAVTAMKEASRLHPEHPPVLARLQRDMMLLLSERDELVPTLMGDAIWDSAFACDDDESDSTNRLKRFHALRRRVIITGALHENAWSKQQWSAEIRRYINEIQFR
ncbi:hypothetical protein PUNSTDRAFT_111392 [Punctularia strigosozonata HHB-11173 SS5]|uniref:uncharacterized protein n=1 Tax=Punctularia strigosozonata (strain HHB-11173) TaxID=741275 RepID=UPI000441626E|nr:uncharacterized protein PUNSTDRAFT_111392 [Punctularia strigosozonata HHB-11173 SS5]EIN13067.1 hypothetical protein PUNSTDRAFT_111392 [Punctularia strigosozonata HHB-11173 SS5]